MRASHHLQSSDSAIISIPASILHHPRGLKCNQGPERERQIASLSREPPGGTRLWWSAHQDELTCFSGIRLYDTEVGYSSVPDQTATSAVRIKLL
jgi:hypothetical protein